MRLYLIGLWITCALFQMPPAHAGYSYSVKINKHEIVVTVQSKTNFNFKVDEKLYKATGKDEKPQTGYIRHTPSNRQAEAHLPGMTVILMSAGPTLYVNAAKSEQDDNHEVNIEVIPAKSELPNTSNMKRINVDGKQVFFDRSRLEGGPVYYFFVYHLKTKNYVYRVTQMYWSNARPKSVPEPFRSALKTFKVREAK